MKAWQLLEEKGWCQHVYARNSAGIPVSTDNESACSFCLLGAMEAANVPLDCYFRLQTHMQQFNKVTAAVWNDRPECTKEKVVALLKELDI